MRFVPPHVVEGEIEQTREPPVREEPAFAAPAEEVGPVNSAGPADHMALLPWMDAFSSAPTQLNPNAPPKPISRLPLAKPGDLEAQGKRMETERLLKSKDLMAGNDATPTSARR